MKSLDHISPKPPEKFKFRVEEITVADERHLKRNEDTLLSLPSKGSFAVFDGMGGRAKGDVASKMARDCLREELEKIPNGLSLDEKIKNIEAVFKTVNDHLLQEIRKNGDLLGMGTTVSLVQFCKDANGKKKIMVVNAGDSRVYILRDNKELKQVTKDDNDFVSPELRAKFDLVTDKKNFTENEKVLLDNRHRISNALGFYFEPRISVQDLQPGDTVIITSDGIHDNLTSAEITNIVADQGDHFSKARGLVEAAQKRSRDNSFRSKPDDMTAIVVSEAV